MKNRNAVRFIGSPLSAGLKRPPMPDGLHRAWEVMINDESCQSNDLIERRVAATICNSIYFFSDFICATSALAVSSLSDLKAGIFLPSAEVAPSRMVFTRSASAFVASNDFSAFAPWHILHLAVKVAAASSTAPSARVTGDAVNAMLSASA